MKLIKAKKSTPCCIDETFSHITIKEIIDLTGNSRVRSELADLSRYGDIRQLVQRWTGPLHLLGSDDVISKEEALTRTPAQREKLGLQIPESVAWIYRFWLPYRQAIYECTVATFIQNNQSRVEGNDLCPSGSGLEFINCCGAAARLH